MKEFDLIGDIGLDITAPLVQSMLDSAGGEDVNFYIASLGGSLHDGSAINGLIEKYPGKTKGFIIGNTASAGTIAILGCDEVVVNDSAAFLIHNSSDPEGGNAVTLRKKAEQLERLDKLMLNIYAKKTGLPEDQLTELMNKEDWLTPSEALTYGFVDSVEQSYKAVAYMSNIKLSKDLQTKLINKMNFFNRKKEDEPVVLNTVNLKDKGQIFFSGETLEVEAEVGLIGAAAIEDGEYPLEDGRILVVSGGAVTEIKSEEPKEDDTEELNAEAIIEAVAKANADAFAEFEAKVGKLIEDKITEVKASIGSNHTPPKGKVIDPKQGDKKNVHAKVAEVTTKIRENIEASRKA